MLYSFKISLSELLVILFGFTGENIVKNPVHLHHPEGQ